VRVTEGEPHVVWPTRVTHQLAQRHAQQPLLPVEAVLVHVGPGQLLAVEPVEDAQLAHQLAHVVDGRLGHVGQEVGVRDQRQHLGPREAPERQLHQRQARVSHAAGARQVQVHHAVRDAVGLGEHGLHVWQVLVARVAGQQHGDLVEPERRVPTAGLANGAPDLLGHHLHLTAHAGAGVKAHRRVRLDAACAGRGRDGRSQQDVALQLLEHAGDAPRAQGAGAGVHEARLEVRLGQLVEQVHVLAAGPPEGHQQGRLVGLVKR
jgi:hypothetical protein